MKTPLHYLVAARQSEIAELEQISRASSLVASMSELVHALQKERGLSNIFLVSGGAQAQQSLLDHGRHVDRVMERVCLALEELGARAPGAHLLAAQRIRTQHPELKTVVTILDDEGEKYLHDFFMHPAAGHDKPLPFH